MIEIISPIRPTVKARFIQGVSPYSFFKTAIRPIEIRGKVTMKIFERLKLQVKIVAKA